MGYRLRAVTAQDHDYQEAVGDVYVEGAVWAEPDIGQAAQWMRLLAGSEVIRKRIGVEAARTMREGFSETAVGRIAEERLRASYDDLDKARGKTTVAMNERGSARCHHIPPLDLGHRDDSGGAGRRNGERRLRGRTGQTAVTPCRAMV